MSETDSEFIDEQVPDESVQLDQLDAEDNLVDRNGVDPLDEGYIAPDDWSVAEGFGNTAAEMRQGETLEQRCRQEEPEQGYDPDRVSGEDGFDDDPTEDDSDPEVGDRRAGRLVSAGGGYPGEDTESELVGEDVGISGAAASAEEAAMHIMDDGAAEDSFDHPHRPDRG
ncbi:DUF5709 domain-containing protein [Enemella evansiae]|uniref:DUF5709 domain-containing protein n=1 Tax=Enemella evansiae TaxID=2016499 RepID=UPI000B97595E|nr:DUF5709 domain-containing protein [Enemella evansiae]OYN93420.1 hypothetical protein CGZ95_18865 [Enemella evansiae]OYO05913.1 hypothetical protein CGZ97_04335 [Enemella evansiae]